MTCKKCGDKGKFWETHTHKTRVCEAGVKRTALVWCDCSKAKAMVANLGRKE